MERENTKVYLGKLEKRLPKLGKRFMMGFNLRLKQKKNKLFYTKESIFLYDKNISGQ